MDAEAELIGRAKSDDEEAFKQLIARHQARVRAVTRANLPASLQKEADDIAQTTFIRAWSRIREFEFRGPGSFQGWLKTIAVRLCINTTRKRAREEPLCEDRESEFFLAGVKDALKE